VAVVEDGQLVGIVPQSALLSALAPRSVSRA
jgi:CBS-domain-containing membrane protein